MLFPAFCGTGTAAASLCLLGPVCQEALGQQAGLLPSMMLPSVECGHIVRAGSCGLAHVLPLRTVDWCMRLDALRWALHPAGFLGNRRCRDLRPLFSLSLGNRIRDGCFLVCLHRHKPPGCFQKVFRRVSGILTVVLLSCLDFGETCLEGSYAMLLCSLCPSLSCTVLVKVQESLDCWVFCGPRFSSLESKGYNARVPSQHLIGHLLLLSM